MDNVIKSLAIRFDFSHKHITSDYFFFLDLLIASSNTLELILFSFLFTVLWFCQILSEKITHDNS